MPSGVFQTRRPDSDGVITGRIPLTVTFNLCRSRPTDEDDELKYTYDWNDDGTVDYFGHCRQSQTFDGPSRVRVCVSDRRPGHDVCRTYEVRPQAETPPTPSPTVLPTGSAMPTAMPTEIRTPTPTATAPPVPTATPTGGATPTPPIAGTETPVPTSTPTRTPTATSTPSATPTPTRTPMPTPSPTPVAGPEIRITGNGTDITSGDTTPSLDDFTDFGSTTVGSSVHRSFVLENRGGGDLHIFDVISLLPFDAPMPGRIVAPGGVTTLNLQCPASTPGRFGGPVLVVSDDADEGIYSFTVVCQVVSATSPEINIRGNGVNIASGDTTPSLADFTDFGTTTVGTPIRRSFVIENKGNSHLHIDDIISLLPFEAPMPDRDIAPGNQTTLHLKCPASSPGIFGGSVLVASNDADESVYSFTVHCRVDP